MRSKKLIILASSWYKLPSGATTSKAKPKQANQKEVNNALYQAKNLKRGVYMYGFNPEKTCCAKGQKMLRL